MGWPAVIDSGITSVEGTEPSTCIVKVQVERVFDVPRTRASDRSCSVKADRDGLSGIG